MQLPPHYVIIAACWFVAELLFLLLPLCTFFTTGPLSDEASSSLDNILARRASWAQILSIPLATLAFGVPAGIATSQFATAIQRSTTVPDNPNDIPGVSLLVATVSVAALLLSILATWAAPYEWDSIRNLQDVVRIARHDAVNHPHDRLWRDQVLKRAEVLKERGSYKRGQRLLDAWPTKREPVSGWRDCFRVTPFALGHFLGTIYALPLLFMLVGMGLFGATDWAEGNAALIGPHLLWMLEQFLAVGAVWFLGLVPWMTGRLISQRRRNEALAEATSIARQPPPPSEAPRAAIEPLLGTFSLFGRPVPHLRLHLIDQRTTPKVSD